MCNVRRYNYVFDYPLLWESSAGEPAGIKSVELALNKFSRFFLALLPPALVNCVYDGQTLLNPLFICFISNILLTSNL